MIGAYRRGDFQDPSSFAAHLCKLLDQYPDAVISEATDTVVGLPAKYKFPPSIAEVKEFCDAAQVRNYQRVHSRPVQMTREARIPPDPCNVFVPAKVPLYPIVHAHLEANPLVPRRPDPTRAGYWVPLHIALACGAHRAPR